MKDITVRFKQGRIRLKYASGKWVWEPQLGNDLLKLVARQATLMSMNYRPSPADGYPGFSLASKVADKLGGEFDPPVIPQGKDEVY